MNDCDDDCADCFPGSEAAPGDGRDHDCSGAVDDLEAPIDCEPGWLEVVGSAETGDSSSVYVTGATVYVGTTAGVLVVDVSEPAAPAIAGSLEVGPVRDVALWGALLLAATPLGLLVVDRTDPADLVVLAGPVATGDSRGVAASVGRAYVAAREGVFVVDLSTPAHPVVVEVVAEPWLHDARDAYSFVRTFGLMPTIAVLSGSTRDHPAGGLTFLLSTRPAFASDWVRAEIPAGSRIAGHCLDTVVVAAGAGVASVFCDSRDVSWISDLAGAEGIGQACWQGCDGCATFVAAADGLHVLDRAGPVAGTEDARDVAAARGHAYVATAAGLRVVSLGCEP